MIEYTETLLARINLGIFGKKSKFMILFFFDREQLRKKAEEDLKENINVIRRNLPAKKDGIAGYLSQTTQEIADQIARNLVDRALELDRKRLVKKIVKLSADSAEEKLKNQKAEMLNNFAEVAVSRVTDQLTTDLIKAASQDVANVMQHKCDGMTFFSPFIQTILNVS